MGKRDFIEESTIEIKKLLVEVTYIKEMIEIDVNNENIEELLSSYEENKEKYIQNILSKESLLDVVINNDLEESIDRDNNLS